jgi:prepilin-type N-terminal cleavage/methylation domain-containing protein
MRRNAGFTLVEMGVAMAIFAAGAIYVYATFAGVTRRTRSASGQIELGSENKRTLTRMFAELQASSLTPQDTDGLDSTEPEAVFLVEDDNSAPVPHTKAKVVTRGGSSATQENGQWTLGANRQQARERDIAKSKRLRFRKVVGYQFNASTGSIVPEWSDWVTFAVNERNQLVRTTASGRTRIVANDIDAFDVDPRADGTVLVTTITARRNPTGAGWRRYANAITIHPKN